MKKAKNMDLKTILFIVRVLFSIALLAIFFSNLFSRDEADSDILISELPAVPDEIDESTQVKNYLEYYNSRCNKEHFLTENEEKILKDMGYIVSADGFIYNPNAGDISPEVFYYPELFNNNGILDFWFVDNFGHLYISSADYIVEDINLGTNQLSGEIKLFSSQEFSLYYFPETNMVSSYSFGEIICSHTLPNESIYVGCSDLEGYIFRSNSNVFSTKYSLRERSFTSKLIAQDVKEVIVADYPLSMENWSQPLFLMEDGTLKVYCGNSSELLDIQTEGGYFVHNFEED